MKRLTHGDLSRLLAAVQQLHGHTDFATLPHLMVELQSQLISADISSFTLMDKAAQRAEVVGVEVNGMEKLRPAFMAHYHEHPIVQHTLKTKELNATKVTDFLTQKQFERTGYFNEFFRHLEVRYQLIYFMFNQPEAELSMQLSSGHQDFSERDRLMADLLRPHFAQAYLNGKTLHDLRERETRTHDAMSAGSQGLIFLTGELKIERMTGICEGWLNRYFDRQQNTSVQLPDALRRWVESQRNFQSGAVIAPAHQSVLVVNGPGARLTVRCLPEAGGKVTLLLTEQPPAEGHTRAFHPLSQLSTRQNEVLSWMVEGKRNAEIAVILGLSVRTVEKHIAQILHHLQAENRATAIVRALDLGRGQLQ